MYNHYTPNSISFYYENYSTIANVSKILHITIAYIADHFVWPWPKINPENVFQLTHTQYYYKHTLCPWPSANGWDGIAMPKICNQFDLNLSWSKKKPHPKLYNECVCWLCFFVFFPSQMISHTHSHTHTEKCREIASPIIYFCELEIKSNKEVVFLSFSILVKFFVFIYCCRYVLSDAKRKSTHTHVHTQTHSKTVKYQTNGPTKFVCESD